MPSKTAKQKEQPVPLPPKPAGPRWWWYIVGILAAVAVGFEIYDPILHAPFIFDDRYLPFMNPAFAQSSIGSWLASVRPLLMLGYWTNFQFSQSEPYSYHIVNVLLHCANAVLVWLIVRRILKWAEFAGTVREALALFGGLLFLVHPAQTESVAYVASRSESQSLLFFLGAFALFLYRRQPVVSVPVTVGVLALFAAAVTSKEHTAVLPALLLLTDYYWNPGFTLEGIRKNWKLYIPIAAGAILAGTFVLRILSGATTAGFGIKEFTWYQYFFTQCRALWVYLRMFILPYDLNVDHDFAISRTILDHGAIAGMLALTGLAVAAWIWRRQYKLASYGFFAFILLMAPTSSFVPIADPLVERRLYVAFFPLILICCDFIMRLRVPRTAVASALALLLILFAGLSYGRNKVWSDPVTLWQDTAAKSPNKSRPHFQLAFAYYSQGQCDEASREYQRASEVSKPDAALYVDWALAEDCARRPQKALDLLQKAAAIEKTAHIYSQIGMLHAKQNQRAEAFAALDEAEKLDPAFAIVYVYRGNLLLLGGDFDKAAADFRKALQLNQSDAAARNGLDLAQRRVVPQVQ